MEQCNLRDCIRSLTPAYAVSNIQSIQNELNDPKGNEITICTVVKYVKKFYDRKTSLWSAVEK